MYVSFPILRGMGMLLTDEAEEAVSLDGARAALAEVATRRGWSADVERDGRRFRIQLHIEANDDDSRDSLEDDAFTEFQSLVSSALDDFDEWASKRRRAMNHAVQAIESAAKGRYDDALRHAEDAASEDEMFNDLLSEMQTVCEEAAEREAEKERLAAEEAERAEES